MDIYSYEKTKYQSIFSSPQKQSQSKGLVSELELVRSKTDRWHTLDRILSRIMNS